MTTPAVFVLDLTRPGRVGLTIDDQAVDAEAVELTAVHGEIPTLVVQVPTGGRVQGAGYIETRTPAADVAAAVRAVDPAAVRKAVDGMRLSAASDPYAATLEAIAALIEAGAP